MRDKIDKVSHEELTKLNDEELAVEFIEGNREAAGILYMRYKSIVASKVGFYINNEDDMNEIVGDIFTELLVSLPRFNPQISKLKTFTISIANHKLADHLRKKYKSNDIVSISDLIALEESGKVSFENSNPNPLALDEQLDEKQKINVAKRAINDLPENERLLAILYYFYELQLEEISQIVNKKYSIVKIAIHRIRQQLRKKVKF